MIVLGIESSCDETAAAILDSGGVIRSNIIASQIADHEIYGGVVPEIASRKHLTNIVPVVDRALETAGVGLEGIEGIAVTQGPGLIGALFVGLSYAKALAAHRGIPFVGVDHLEGHLMSPLLEDREIRYPFVGLVVSGGHTSIYLVRGFGDYEVLGRTLDDAAGEAFDKVAKHLGLGYPGGVVIDRLAQRGDPTAIPFPRAWMGKTLDFSFSGIKTAVRTHVERQGVTEETLPDLCASFQEAIVDVLVTKTLRAAQREGVGQITLAGGVAANSRLRRRLEEAASQAGMRVSFPSPILCTDNAAMIAHVGQYRLEGGRHDPLSLPAYSRDRR
ncbi:MAG: tRNA (adenosine(37)-N6)-threonylcarbamoyltransferase complex transferase subunit TsaD [Deltaproteobacteria bacterium]|nr:MAG: tRNA (adenosine(37)-N6)-threonylcarbamoyltransferase complex transferase subunit TsaD [Deltaproteobacteria bacterium]